MKRINTMRQLVKAGESLITLLGDHAIADCIYYALDNNDVKSLASWVNLSDKYHVSSRLMKACGAL